MVLWDPWWDTVDGMASNLVGPLVMADRINGQEQMREWLDHDNLWVRRASILHQLRYQAKTDKEFLFEACTKMAPETDFFARKAVGWVLRHYSRTNAKAVRQYLDSMGDSLSPLSRREGGKYC
mmetsp:Transcript_22312/g.34957  ORF Transcript_22312/g.34957 Transcript_22312/m.34957 type:complete len:123 (+) Transcript_22312:182-550(+)